MRCSLRRARSRPGPLFFAALSWIVVPASVARAHDPGLSALDVRVRGREVSAVLALSPGDAAGVVDRARPRGQPVGSGRIDLLRQLAADALELSLDGERLPSAGPEVLTDARGTAIQLSFPLPAATSAHGRRLTVTSSVPARMPSGHRELLTVDVDGRVMAETLLDAGSNPVTVVLDRPAASPRPAAWSFLLAGVHHILSGYDHLVFLAGLLLASRSVRQLLVALSAFTAAHSVSLTLVVAGGVHAPAAIVEPLIAASIAWIGVENLRGERRAPRWFVVFGFGLIHGFGLAGALMDLGLGSSALGVALALVSFNAGVELGQLAVAAGLLPLVGAIRSRPAWSARFVPACSVLIALSGGYWLIQRLSF